MPEPGSKCLACGASNSLKYPARRRRGLTGGSVPAEELACTSPYLGEYEEIWGCRACGLAYQLPPAGNKDLEDAYAEVSDPLYLVEEERRREEFRELLGRLEAFKPAGGRLLEVGSFAGLCLDEAKKRGWNPSGLEPSRWGVEHAKSRFGVDAINGTLVDAPFEPESFEAVCAWDVLEHLPDPLGDLERMHKLLKPQGVIAFTTIDIESKGSKILRRRWPWLMRMHLYYFTPRSLELLVRKAGFVDFHIERHPKRFRLSYMLKRGGKFLGPLAGPVQRSFEKLGLGNRVVKFDLGDIVLVVARKE